MTTLAPPIDPFAACPDGVYRDELVDVAALGTAVPRRALGTVRTEHFDAMTIGGRLRLGHRIGAEQLDDNLPGLIARELFAPGWLRGADLLERIVTGIVLTTCSDAVTGWETYYRNTLAGVQRLIDGRAGPLDHGSLADYAPVYAHAQHLVLEGPALELGCSLGFLSIRLALAGVATTASDINPGTIALLDAVAPRLGAPLHTRAADAAHYPDRPGSVATVLAIHLLEHLDPEVGDRVLSEALRLARRRVVVAVPLEEEADEVWGHVRTISLSDLREWGRRTGLPHDVHEYHGGWLVIDKVAPEHAYGRR